MTLQTIALNGIVMVIPYNAPQYMISGNLIKRENQGLENLSDLPLDKYSVRYLSAFTDRKKVLLYSRINSSSHLKGRLIVGT